MAQPLKICAQCLASLRESGDGQRDLAVYLMGTGAGGVEIVPVENCQARLTGHNETPSPLPPAGRTLADVTADELNQAIAWLLKQLRLPPEHSGEAWDLENAIKAEWLKALEVRRREERELLD
ncbi:MAG: hypothetical protein FWH51_02050 [Dehalococcoidia bacterium]|nr:hypothetical protein [Dehalococcoidia bacterium]